MKLFFYKTLYFLLDIFFYEKCKWCKGRMAEWDEKKDYCTVCGRS